MFLHAGKFDGKLELYIDGEEVDGDDDNVDFDGDEVVVKIGNCDTDDTRADSRDDSDSDSDSDSSNDSSEGLNRRLRK